MLGSSLVVGLFFECFVLHQPEFLVLRGKFENATQVSVEICISPCVRIPTALEWAGMLVQ